MFLKEGVPCKGAASFLFIFDFINKRIGNRSNE